MNRNTGRTAALVLGLALSSLGLTGCETGWEGTGVVNEMEMIDPRRHGDMLQHDGLEITVKDKNNNERSVVVDDCKPGNVILDDVLTVDDVERLCGEVRRPDSD